MESFSSRVGRTCNYCWGGATKQHVIITKLEMCYKRTSRGDESESVFLSNTSILNYFIMLGLCSSVLLQLITPLDTETVTAPSRLVLKAKKLSRKQKKTTIFSLNSSWFSPPVSCERAIDSERRTSICESFGVCVCVCARP